MNASFLSHRKSFSEIVAKRLKALCCQAGENPGLNSKYIAMAITSHTMINVGSIYHLTHLNKRGTKETSSLSYSIKTQAKKIDYEFYIIICAAARLFIIILLLSIHDDMPTCLAQTRWPCGVVKALLWEDGFRSEFFFR